MAKPSLNVPYKGTRFEPLFKKGKPSEKDEYDEDLDQDDEDEQNFGESA